MGFSSNQAITGLAILGVAFVVAMNPGLLDTPASAIGGNGPGGGGGSGNGCGFATSISASSDNCGAGSSVDVATFDKAADSRTQVASTVYANQIKSSSNANEVFDLGSKSSGASSRGSFTNVVVGDKVEGYAFDSTYPYTEKFTQVVSDKGGHNVDLDVVKGVDTPLVEVYDENNDKITSNPSFGSGQTKTWQRLRIQANASNKAYNVGMVCYDAPNNASSVDEVSIGDDRLTEVSNPDRLSGQEQCWKFEDRVGPDGEVEDIMQDYEDINLETVTVDIADGVDPAGAFDIKFTVADYAAYIDSKKDVADRLAYGIEDEDDNDVGEGDGTKTVTLG